MHPELGSTTKIMPPPVTVHQFFRIHCLSVLKASDYSMHENQCHQPLGQSKNGDVRTLVPTELEAKTMWVRMDLLMSIGIIMCEISPWRA